MDQIVICRVCRSSESSPEDPLFYPCKCSGSMKWVHQSCLENWLRVSKKSKCEICDFEFIFSTIYSLDTPQSLPVSLLVSSVWKKLTQSINRGIRILMVLFCWTIVAPVGTLFIYESFFKPVDETASLVYSGLSKVGALISSGLSFIFGISYLDLYDAVKGWNTDIIGIIWDFEKFKLISKDIIEIRWAY